MPGSPNKLLTNKTLLIILGSGLILKLLYLFFIGPAVFSNWNLTTSDSRSYSDTFLNLINNGEYTHDPKFKDASYGRLPVVVFLWGIFYLLLGEAKASIGIAVFQILLDVLTTYLVYKIVSKLFYERIALIVSFVYAIFPLTFYFVVITDTEYLSLFLVIAVFYKLLHFKNDLKNCLSLVALLMLGFYTREILLLLIPVSFLYLWRNFDLSPKKYFLISFLLLLFYLPWPIRNYARSEKLILIKPLSAGYADYQEDMLAYMYWLYAWHDGDVDEYLEYSFRLDKEVKFPEEIFSNEHERKLAYDLVHLAQHCGSGFIVWQRGAEWEHKQHSCDHTALIGRGFDVLQKNYKMDHPFNYYLKVPFQNLKKAFFKSSLTDPHDVNNGLFVAVMIFRSIILFLGLMACLVNWRIDYFKMSFIFFVVIYFVICFILRQVEMRYLFQADVLMLIAATAYIADLFYKKKLK